MTSRELARIRAFDPGYPTFLGIDDRLQRLLKWSYEILRIDSPKNKDELWEEILRENGIKKSKSHAKKKGFVIVLDPRHVCLDSLKREQPKKKIYEILADQYLQIPEEIATKMKVLECPLTKR